MERDRSGLAMMRKLSGRTRQHKHDGSDWHQSEKAGMECRTDNAEAATVLGRNWGYANVGRVMPAIIGNRALDLGSGES